MILNPQFYEIDPLRPAQRAEARASLGFDPAQPVGLVLFGGQGAAENAGDRPQLAGPATGADVRSQPESGDAAGGAAAPGAGFHRRLHQEVPRYMQLADYFIGKPGPGSLSEAVAMRLPVIVERNAWTLPQERFNASGLASRASGSMPNFRRIARVVDEMLEPAAYARFRAATERLHNRAVFEIPDILESILRSS